MIITNSSVMPRSKNKSASVRAREAKLAMRLLRVKRLKASTTQGDDEEQNPQAEQSKRQQGSLVKKASAKKKKGDDADSGQVKAAIAAHPGNLDAAEAACVELADADDGTSSPNRPASPVHESKRAQEEHILPSLQKNKQQPKELIQNLGQPQTISERTAFANYVHDSLLTMKKSKFKRMRLAINKLLTQAMDDSEDEDEPGPHPTVQPNMPPPVRSVSPNIL